MNIEDVQLVRPIFELTKGLLEIQAKQQILIEGLRRSYAELLGVLAGDGEPAASPPPRSAAQDAAISKAAKEIAELEALFSRETEPGETKTP
jgi:hypothetical protein